MTVTLTGAHSLSSAIFSDDMRYRYVLRRAFSLRAGTDRRVLFIMLNPSTADHEKNDPTITRCINYAGRWGYERMSVCNIFALRSTDPDALYAADDPIGLGNDESILLEARDAALVICAWGTHGAYRDRGRRVATILEEYADLRGRLHVLGLTQEGYPKHPLYLRKDLKPMAYKAP